MDKKKVLILVSDHNGWAPVQYLSEKLKDKFIIINLTPIEKETLHYPEQARLLADVMKRNEEFLGVAVCGTGQGLNIELNRHVHLRAALCSDVETACLGKSHNNANVLSLGAWKNSNEEMLEMIEKWANTPWEKGRHQIRVEQLNRGKLKNVIICPGYFDVLKPSHVSLLREASKIGKVVVLLNSDASYMVNNDLNGCLTQDEDSRKKVLEALDCVDEVIINEYETAEYWIKQIGAEYVMKGALDTEENIRKIDGIPDDVKLILFKKC